MLIGIQKTHNKQPILLRILRKVKDLTKAIPGKINFPLSNLKF
jgi:hypothetical protein